MVETALRVVERNDMDKQKALEAALGQIERSFGKGSVMKLGQRDTAVEAEAVAIEAVVEATEQVTELVEQGADEGEIDEAVADLEASISSASVPAHAEESNCVWAA